MEEVMSLKEDDRVLLVRELGANYEVQVTGYATPAQSPSPSQQGFQTGRQGLALFVKDNQRRNYYITVIDFIQQAKVLEVRVTHNLVYWKNPRQTCCHSMKDENGGSIGMIFADPSKADLFYNVVAERINILKRKIAARSSPQPPSSGKPRSPGLNVRHQHPSPPSPFVKPRVNRSSTGSVSSISPTTKGSEVDHPHSRFNLTIQTNPPILPSPNSKPRGMGSINPITAPLSRPTSLTTAPYLTTPTTPPISPSLTTPTVPTPTLTTPNLLASEKRGQSPTIPSTTELDPCKRRPELQPPSFDNPGSCPQNAATTQSKLFKAPRRTINNHGSRKKNIPLFPKGATSTSSGGMSHIAHYDGGAADQFQYQEERPPLPVKIAPSHNTSSTQPNSSAPWTHTQTATSSGQFRLPPIGTGLPRTSPIFPTEASPPFSRPFNRSVTSKPRTKTNHIQESLHDDTTSPPVSQEFWEMHNQPSSARSSTPSWTPLASQESWKPQNESSTNSATPFRYILASQESWEHQNQPSARSSTPSWTPLASQESWEHQNQPSTTSGTPSWAPTDQSRGPELHLPRYPPPLPPIQNLTLLDDSEEFPPPPPPGNCSVPPHFNGINQRPHHQNSAAVDPAETLLQSIVSTNPLARLRKVGVEQSPSPVASGGGNDMISSLQKELLKRKKVIQDPIYTGELESDNDEWDED